MASPKFSLTLAALLLLFSYSSINKETVADNSDVVIINIDDIKTLDDAKLTDLISDYAYIPLETSEEALVGQITTIAFDENRIFILDRITTVIHVFTKDGKFLHKLEAKGNGPEEFSEIESFTLNKEKNHIIIGAIGKILTFDYEGKFINAFKTISGGSAQIAYAGDGKLLIYSSLYYLDTAQGFNQAGIIDLRTKEYVTKDIPFNPKSRMENITLFYNSISYGNADVKYLSIPYKDNVWEVSGSSINAAYKIDFGENSLPENYEDDYISNSRYSSDDLRNIETKEGWERIRGGGVLFNQNMLCFNYATKGKFQQVYYDINTNRAFQIKLPLKNDLDGTSYVAHQGSYSDKLVSWLSPSTLKKNVSEGKITEERIITLTQTLKEEDNPVLRLLTFKPIQ